MRYLVWTQVSIEVRARMFTKRVSRLRDLFGQVATRGHLVKKEGSEGTHKGCPYGDVRKGRSGSGGHFL